MLHLLLQAGSHRYALEVSQVVEVLPLLHLQPLPLVVPAGRGESEQGGQPLDVRGVFYFHGAPVSVIDLGQRLAGAPVAARLSTRIVLVERPEGPSEQWRVPSGQPGSSPVIPPSPARLGLLVERVLGTRAFAPSDFSRAHALEESGPDIAAVATDRHGLIYKLELNQLLSAASPPARRPVPPPLSCASRPSKSY